MNNTNDLQKKEHKATKKKNGSPKNNTKRKVPKTIMQEFKTQGITALEKLSKIQLNNIVKEANKQYHAHQTGKQSPILTDAEYDIVKEYLENKYPNADALRDIGADVPEKQKVDLPINMPSMDKIKPDSEALSQWCKKYKGPYVLSCKLDGVSGLYYTMDNKSKLYTRGNGKIGQDVSHLLKSIKLPDKQNIIVRGEFIVSKTVFNTKYKNDFANIRNMVAGIINRKTLDKKAKDVDFIAYEVIEPVIKPSEQMSFLKENGFNTVKNDSYNTITNDLLSEILVNWRENYEYEIDGIIVNDDNSYARLEGNPDHAFAFKMVISDQLAETQVTDVIWTASKDGYLKPRVRVNPVHIGGVKIEFATGFNGQYIESNKIGIGAIIQLVRSGDVIPYIKSVSTPAESAKMPDVPYTWTDTHVDIILANKSDDPVVLEKRITSFFTGLEIDGLSSGNVKRLIKGGYNTIPKVLHMKESDFLEVEGFKEKMANKIFTSIKSKIQNASLVKIMAASGTMGRGLGERKLKPIMEKYPNILISGETENEKMEMLINVDGIGKENAKTFIENIPILLQFITECKLTERLRRRSATPDQKEPEDDVTTHPLYGKKIVFTGFRDKAIMEMLENKYKVTFVSSVNKNTNLVVVKNKNDTNKKIDQAKLLGIDVLDFNEFKIKFN